VVFLQLNSERFRAFLKITAWVVLLTFTATNVSWADPSGVSLAQIQSNHPLTEKIKKLSISERLARVDEIFLPERVPPDSPFVVYLQDAHSNLGAQKSISELAHILGKKLDIEAILVEGGIGEANLDTLRAFPNQKTKEEVSEYWLRKAVLTGIEREAIVGPRDYRFFGIEDQALYEAGGEAFVKAAEQRTALLHFLNPKFQEVEAKRKEVFNPALQRFVVEVDRFKRGDKLIPLVSLLANEARNRYVNRWKYLEIEKLIDLILIEMQGGNPERYFRIQKELDVRKLFEQLDALEIEVKETLFRSDEERKLDWEHQALSVLKNVVSLEATPSDVAFLNEHKEAITVIARQLLKQGRSNQDFEISSLPSLDRDDTKELSFPRKSGSNIVNPPPDQSSGTGETSGQSPLDQPAVKPGMTGPESASTSFLAETISYAQSFYATAQGRDQMMFQNLTRILDTEGMRRAILVTGGFHAPGMTKRLRQHKIPYVLITPQISEEDNYKNYFARVAGSRADLDNFKNEHSLPRSATYAAPSALLSARELNRIYDSFNLLGGIIGEDGGDVSLQSDRKGQQRQSLEQLGQLLQVLQPLFKPLLWMEKLSTQLKIRLESIPLKMTERGPHSFQKNLMQRLLQSQTLPHPLLFWQGIPAEVSLTFGSYFYPFNEKQPNMYINNSQYKYDESQILKSRSFSTKSELRTQKDLAGAVRSIGVFFKENRISIWIGVFGGFLSANLGMGGGFITMPYLHYYFKRYHAERNFKEAAFISVTTMLFTTPVSVASHGVLNPENYLPLDVLSIVPGALLGTAIGLLAFDKWHSRTLKKMFAVFLFLVSASYLPFNLPFEPRFALGFEGLQRAGALSLLGVAALFFGPLFGMGGGAIMVPSLLSLFLLSDTQAVMTSQHVMLFSAPVAAYFQLKKLNGGNQPTRAGLNNLLKKYMGIVTALSLGSFLAIPFGAYTVNFLIPDWLFKIILGGALAVISMFMLFEKDRATQPIHRNELGNSLRGSEDTPTRSELRQHQAVIDEKPWKKSLLHMMGIQETDRRDARRPAVPNWQRLNVVGQEILNQYRKSPAPIRVSDIETRVIRRLKEEGIDDESLSVESFVEELVKNKLLRKVREQYQLSVSRHIFAIKMSYIRYIYDDLNAILTAVAEARESRPENTGWLEDQFRGVIINYAKAAEEWPLAPVESKYPILKAIQLLSRDQKRLLVQLLDDQELDLKHFPLVNSILLKHDTINAIQQWLPKFAQNLVGRDIIYISSETWLPFGGLGRVGQFVTMAMAKLVGNYANVVTIEPRYRYKTHIDSTTGEEKIHVTRTDGDGNEYQELDPIDYTKLPTPIENVNFDQPDYEFEVLVFKKGRRERVKAQVFKGQRKFKFLGFEFSIDAYFIMDESDYFTRYGYRYDRYGTASWSEFTEFISKASLKLARRIQKDKLDQLKSQQREDRYKPPVIWGNDSQLSLVSVYKRVSDEIEELQKGKRRGDKEIPKEEEPLSDLVLDERHEVSLRNALVHFTTHTIPNRRGEWTIDKLKQIGFTSHWHHYQDEYFRRLNSERDGASGGIRTADTVNAVAEMQAASVRHIDGDHVIVAIANGDDLLETDKVFLEILERLFPGTDLQDITPEQMREVKRAAKLRLKEHALLNKLDPTFAKLDPNKLTLIYDGRLVPEKAGLERALVYENLKRLIKSGVQVILMGNVQGSEESRNMYQKLKKWQEEFNDPDSHPEIIDQGLLIVASGWGVLEERLALAAADASVADSTPGTEAAGWTERRGNVIVITVPGYEGLYQQQGEIVEDDLGQTLIARSETSEAYREVFERLIDEFRKAPIKVSKRQVLSAKLGGVLDALLTAANYLLEFSHGLERKENPIDALIKYASGNEALGNRFKVKWLRRDLIKALRNQANYHGMVREFDNVNNPIIKAFYVKDLAGKNQHNIVLIEERSPDEEGNYRNGNIHFKERGEWERILNELEIFEEDAAVEFFDAMTGEVYEELSYREDLKNQGKFVEIPERIHIQVLTMEKVRRKVRSGQKLKPREVKVSRYTTFYNSSADDRVKTKLLTSLVPDDLIRQLERSGTPKKDWIWWTPGDSFSESHSKWHSDRIHIFANKGGGYLGLTIATGFEGLGNLDYSVRNPAHFHMGLEIQGNTLKIEHGRIDPFPEADIKRYDQFEEDRYFAYWLRNQLIPSANADGFERLRIHQKNTKSETFRAFKFQRVGDDGYWEANIEDVLYPDFHEFRPELRVQADKIQKQLGLERIYEWNDSKWLKQFGETQLGVGEKDSGPVLFAKFRQGGAFQILGQITNSDGNSEAFNKVSKIEFDVDSLEVVLMVRDGLENEDERPISLGHVLLQWDTEHPSTHLKLDPAIITPEDPYLGREIDFERKEAAGQLAVTEINLELPPTIRQRLFPRNKMIAVILDGVKAEAYVGRTLLALKKMGNTLEKVNLADGFDEAREKLKDLKPYYTIAPDGNLQVNNLLQTHANDVEAPVKTLFHPYLKKNVKTLIGHEGDHRINLSVGHHLIEALVRAVEKHATQVQRYGDYLNRTAYHVAVKFVVMANALLAKFLGVDTDQKAYSNNFVIAKIDSRGIRHAPDPTKVFQIVFESEKPKQNKTAIRIKEKMEIIIRSPHPDDAEILTGLLMLRLLEHGIPIHNWIYSSGENAVMDDDPLLPEFAEELARSIRKKNAIPEHLLEFFVRMVRQSLNDTVSSDEELLLQLANGIDVSFEEEGELSQEIKSILKRLIRTAEAMRAGELLNQAVGGKGAVHVHNFAMDQIQQEQDETEEAFQARKNQIVYEKLKPVLERHQKNFPDLPYPYVLPHWVDNHQTHKDATGQDLRVLARLAKELEIEFTLIYYPALWYGLDNLYHHSSVRVSTKGWSAKEKLFKNIYDLKARGLGFITIGGLTGKFGSKRKPYLPQDQMGGIFAESLRRDVFMPKVAHTAGFTRVSESRNELRASANKKAAAVAASNFWFDKKATPKNVKASLLDTRHNGAGGFKWKENGIAYLELHHLMHSGAGAADLNLHPSGEEGFGEFDEDSVYELQEVTQEEGRPRKLLKGGEVVTLSGQEIIHFGLSPHEPLQYGVKKVYRFVKVSNSLPQRGSDKYRRLLRDSLKRYKKYAPVDRFQHSFVAREIEMALLREKERSRGYSFEKLFKMLAQIVKEDPLIRVGDLTSVVGDVISYREDLRDILDMMLINVAVRSRSKEPNVSKTAIQILRSADIGEVVLVSAETLWSSGSGGLAQMVSHQSEELAQNGIQTTVITPLFYDDKAGIFQKHLLRDTGRVVIVPFDNGGGHIEHAMVRIYEAIIEGVRVLFLENDAYFTRLKGTHSVYEGKKNFRLRFSRMISLGSLLAIREMNLHPSIIQTNEWPPAFLKAFLEGREGIDSNLGYRELWKDQHFSRVVDKNKSGEDEYELRTKVNHIAHHLGDEYTGKIWAENPDYEETELRDLIYYDLGMSPSESMDILVYDPQHDRFKDFLDGISDTDRNRELIINPAFTAFVTADHVRTVSEGYHDRTLNARFNQEFGGLVPLFRWKHYVGSYDGVSNGFGQVRRQKTFFRKLLRDPLVKAAIERDLSELKDEKTNPDYVAFLEKILLTPDTVARSFLEIGHNSEKRKLAKVIFDYVQPLQKERLQKALGLDPNPDAFLYSFFHRIDYQKGYQFLLSEIWNLHESRKLKIVGEQFFEAPDYEMTLDEEAHDRLLQYARENNRDTLRAVEVAMILFSDAQFMVAGSVDKGEYLDLGFTDVARRFPEQFRYLDYFVRPDNPLYELIYSGFTLFAMPSLFEPSGLSHREAAAFGVLRHLTRRDGLKDSEIQIHGLKEGFNDFNPVAWFHEPLSNLHSTYQRHVKRKRKRNLSGKLASVWERGQYEAITQNNHWRPRVRNYIELYRRLNGKNQTPDLPTLEVAGAIHRARKQNHADPADELIQAGFTGEDAVKQVVLSLKYSENETLIGLLINKRGGRDPYIVDLVKLDPKVTRDFVSMLESSRDDPSLRAIRFRFTTALNALGYRSELRNLEEPLFVGEHIVHLDTQFRFSVPAKFGLKPADELLIHANEGLTSVYPRAYWLSQVVEKIPAPLADQSVFFDRRFNSVFPAHVESGSRLHLSTDVRNHSLWFRKKTKEPSEGPASKKVQFYIVGVGAGFEVWSEDGYLQHKNSDEYRKMRSRSNDMLPTGLSAASPILTGVYRAVAPDRQQRLAIPGVWKNELLKLAHDGNVIVWPVSKAEGPVLRIFSASHFQAMVAKGMPHDSADHAAYFRAMFGSGWQMKINFEDKNLRLQLNKQALEYIGNPKRVKFHGAGLYAEIIPVREKNVASVDTPSLLSDRIQKSELRYANKNLLPRLNQSKISAESVDVTPSENQNRIAVSLDVLSKNNDLRKELREVLELNRENKALEIAVVSTKNDLVAEREFIRLFNENLFLKYRLLQLYGNSRLGFAYEADLWVAHNRTTDLLKKKIGVNGREFTSHVVTIVETGSQITRRDTPKVLAHKGALQSAMLLFPLEDASRWFELAPDGVLDPAVAFLEKMQLAESARIYRARAA
jgi:uncharacterized protein